MSACMVITKAHCILGHGTFPKGSNVKNELGGSATQQELRSWGLEGSQLNEQPSNAVIPNSNLFRVEKRRLSRDCL